MAGSSMPARAARFWRESAWCGRSATWMCPRIRVSPSRARGRRSPVPNAGLQSVSAMCNDYEQHVTWAQYCKMMQDLALGIPTQQSELDLPQADDIKINDLGPVMRAAGNGIELAPMRFGFPPSNPRGGPIFNFRFEGRRF